MARTAPAPGSLSLQRALASSIAPALAALLFAGCARTAGTRSASPDPSAAAAQPEARASDTRASGAPHLPPSRLPAATAAPKSAPTSAPAPATAAATAPPAIASPAVSGVKTQAPGPVTTAIYSASASPSVVHAGQTVTWVVATSSDVTDVQATVSVYHFSLARAGAGRFVLSFSVPADVPPFFHGHYDVQLTAHGNGSASGALAIDFE